MKPMLIAAWICLGLEVLAVCAMWFSPKSGDAASAGMARELALLFAAFVATAGLLLAWGTWGGNLWGLWGGSALSLLPAVIGVVLALPNFVPNFGRMLYQAQAGRFEDWRLTSIAGAITSGNYSRARDLVHAGPVDWKARDKQGKTLLGVAVQYNMDAYAGQGRLDGLRVLLEAGAPLDPEALGELEGLLMPSAVGTNVALLQALLEAGGDANAVDRDGTPLTFMSYVDMEKLRLLVKHGANVNARDPDPMNHGQSLLLHFAGNGRWEEVGFLIESGADTGYRAADGATLGSILAEANGEGAQKVRRMIVASNAE